ncbi:MAG: decaprenyl-phosphate phosphoribosyltransferase [Acidobacteria bacterium ACB1]|nr:decaprenyl-phosphate phosphoribosyltransferase [Acidobacteria bacterium ACB1]RIJ90432.1 MAG: decaprenyl-phosphate phosphoribosyltransferase [Acidobacteriota bacterium]
MNEQFSALLSDKTVGIEKSRSSWPAYLISAARPHQWSKNLFVLAPLLFSGRLDEASALGRSLLAFAVFCLLSSSLYIFNDWVDLEEDRAHPEKSKRPLASGQLPASVALAFAALLAASSLGLSYFLGLPFFLTVLSYFILILAYCLGLKRMIVVDCMVIALGFVLRVVGGAVAISVSASHWLVVCAFLLALFLAFSKRRQELIALSDNAGSHRTVLKFYSVAYLGQVNVVLVAASIVCYALYTVAPETVAKFHTDALIYGTVFVIYGMLRYMALIEDPKYGGNPSKLLMQDKPLIFTLLLWSVFNVAVVYYESFQGTQGIPFGIGN